jgi:AcrR family transcriptional regulator/ribosomal protein S18 acetylase RimI-like enzyme
MDLGPYQGPRRRRHILDTAAGLVAADGYPAVTMQAVAAAAGVGKQTLYRWWAGRPPLFIDVYLHLVPAADLVGSGGPGAPVAQDPGAPAVQDPGAPAVQDNAAAVLVRLFRRYRQGPAAAILAGLLGDAAGDPAARGAIEAGLMTGRQDLLRRCFAAAGTPAPGWAAEAAVAMVWQRVLLGGPFEDADALRIAGAAAALPAPSPPRTPRVPNGPGGEGAGGSPEVPPPAAATMLAGYRPGAVGLLAGWQAQAYAASHGFGAAFEAKVAGDMAAFLARYRDSRDLFLTAWQGDGLLGGLALDAGAGEPAAADPSPGEGAMARLRWVYLRPEARGLGLGRAMLDRAVARARQIGAAGVTLTTLAGLEAAGRLYERLGFVVVERRVGRTWGWPVEEIRMDLRF